MDITLPIQRLELGQDETWHPTGGADSGMVPLSLVLLRMTIIFHEPSTI